MNSPIKCCLTILAGISLVATLTAGTVTTGTVTAVNQETGAVTVLSDQTKAPVNYTQIDKTKIVFGSGTVAALRDISVGQRVTVQYGMVGRQPVVTRFLIPDESTPATTATTVPLQRPLTAAEQQALTSKAARDNDITTEPGVKARIDNDITTQPGKKALIDGDITTQPGKKALIDGDITTQPGRKALIDNDITTNPGKIPPNNRDITKSADK